MVVISHNRFFQVSIHAPWEGCDVTANTSLTKLQEFQFTHPGKGATTQLFRAGILAGVSIHAPWEGCDSLVFLICSVTVLFQFTHPGKGATCPRQ